MSAAGSASGRTRTDWRRTRSLVRAELAGRAWRLLNRPLPLAKDAVVTFAIPLIGRASAGDWDRVSDRLAATVSSLLRQTDPRWEAIICGQDRPEGLPEDSRVRFQRYPHAAQPGAITDKYDKIPFILSGLSREPRRDGYLVFLDADDILHPRLVAHMMTAAEPGGYLIESGYMLDAATGEIGRLEPPRAQRPSTTPFHEHCGSCSAIRIDRARWYGWRLPVTRKGQHQWQRRNLRSFGLHLAPVPFPAAIYVVNHGENTRQRRGKMSAKMQYLARNRLDADEARQVLTDFGLDPR
jgi:hypothetical protein